MFGFACRETHTADAAADLPGPSAGGEPRQAAPSGELKFVRPDAKSQVTVEYNADGTPHRIHTVVLSTQHDESVMVKKRRQAVLQRRGPARS